MRNHSAVALRPSASGTNSVGTTNGAILSFTTGNTNPTAPNGKATGTTGDQNTVTVNSFTGTTVTFTPASNFTGSGSFTHTVGDGFGGSATGTIARDRQRRAGDQRRAGTDERCADVEQRRLAKRADVVHQYVEPAEQVPRLAN